jgi:NAD(P)H-hydrate epimerase
VIVLGNQTFVKGVQTQIYTFEQEDSEKLFPPFAEEDIHKGHRGHLWVCAGSPGFWGSGIMAAKAAVRCGAGYCTLVSTHNEVHFVPMSHPELMTAVMSNPNLIWKSIKAPSALIIGPGFGVIEKLEKFFEYLLSKASDIPVIVDADALTVLARLAGDEFFALPEKWILTPHEGEMARLLRKPVEQIHADREAAIIEAYQKFKCTILLKGHHSIVLSDLEKMFLISAGNPVLAKAGTGDVLAGMIGGLLSQGYKSIDACLLGSYWHAAFGDWYIKKMGMEFCLRASEISDLLPLFWKENYAIFMQS